MEPGVHAQLQAAGCHSVVCKSSIPPDGRSFKYANGKDMLLAWSGPRALYPVQHAANYMVIQSQRGAHYTVAAP